MKHAGTRHPIVHDTTDVGSGETPVVVLRVHNVHMRADIAVNANNLLGSPRDFITHACAG